MTVIKTAISLQEPLFQKLEKLAAEQNVSRSRLVALALEIYIEQQENLKLLRELNAAYGDDQAEERDNTQRYLAHQRAIQEDEW